MSIRAEKAVEYKKSYNCAQAVLLPFKKELNKSEDELLALDSGFGAGMGSMEATCGALCDAAIAAELLNQSNTPTKMMTKEMLMELMRKPVQPSVAIVNVLTPIEAGASCFHENSVTNS